MHHAGHQLLAVVAPVPGNHIKILCNIAFLILSDCKATGLEVSPHLGGRRGVAFVQMPPNESATDSGYPMVRNNA
jgi:hypothetical protein